MQVTDVRIKLATASNAHMRAYAMLTLDDALVIRDLRVIAGQGGLFVAMPSRKSSDHCPGCRAKTDLIDKFCASCGADIRARVRPEACRLHMDTVFPITESARAVIHEAVLDAYEAEVERSAMPDYVSSWDEQRAARIEGRKAVCA